MFRNWLSFGQLSQGLAICVCFPSLMVIPRLNLEDSGHSAISLDEKHIVVSNLYDGLDWYSVADRSLSHTVQCPINQQMNLPVPVLFTHDGETIIMGGTCGSARLLDASTSETIQTLPHAGMSPPHPLISFFHFAFSRRCCSSGGLYFRPPPLL